MPIISSLKKEKREKIFAQMSMVRFEFMDDGQKQDQNESDDNENDDEADLDVKSLEDQQLIE